MLEMLYIWTGFAFCFGAIIGSFLNVVLYRLHTGKSLNGHSHCLSCARSLRWYELVPVLSYIALRGRCRTCHSAIPSRYALVELLSGISWAFLWLYTYPDFVLFLFHAAITSILLVILVYDLRHTIIPDEMVLMLLATAVGISLYQFWPQFSVWAVQSLLGAVAASSFFAFLWLVSKGRWIGLGDAKLAVPLGIIVGVNAVFSLVVIAFWIGAVVSICILIIQRINARGKTPLRFFGRQLTMKSEVPFAPFLIAAYAVVHFFHVDVFTLTYVALL